MTPSPLSLNAEQARWVCPLEWIPAETTEGVEPIEGIIGQDRAIRALKMGVMLNSPGYNIFVSGLSGTGKATTIKRILDHIHPDLPPPVDLCYVHHFRNPDNPLLLRFPRGTGAQFRDHMAEAIAMLKTRVTALFEDAEYVARREDVQKKFQEKHAALLEALTTAVGKDGFVLGQIQDGQSVRPDLLFQLPDKVVSIADVMELAQTGKMPAEQAKAALEAYRTHHDAMDRTLRESVQIGRELQRAIAEFDRGSILYVVQTVLSEILGGYQDPKVKDYLAQLEEFLVAHPELFQPNTPEGSEDLTEATEFKVNLVLDNASTGEFPVIIEMFPTFVNLFGLVERQQDAQGVWFTDFTRIKAGSLIKADGGYLVLNAADMLSEPGVWRYLQRALLYREQEIPSSEAIPGQGGTALKPETITLNVKVILIGNDEIYSFLSAYERDFKKIFKVKASFDYEIPMSEESVQNYSALVRKLVSDEGLNHFDNKAIASLVEYGARIAGSRRKLTTQFSEIADIVREANYWCKQNSNTYVTSLHVERAIDQSRDRHALYEDKMQEMIENGMILINVEGSRIGQINGLAVYGGERYSFGKPSRITASVGVGEKEIINIERESGLSGSSHDKGILIISGFLREMFAQNHPLTLTAGISFEQSYGGVDGDSASSTEIYALLSALAGLPIRQDLAVTGSINQKGDIQPIGGVNEKIEGFFDVCVRQGLTGTQGVLIPVQNVPDLMLDTRVVEVMKNGRFHLYAVSRVEEGIELLMGRPAGAKLEDGTWPEDSVYGLVAARLAHLAEVGKKSS